MYLLGYLFREVGIWVIVISLILLVDKITKKEPVKKFLKVLSISLILFMISFIMYDSSEKFSDDQEEAKAQEEPKAKEEVESEIIEEPKAKEEIESEIVEELKVKEEDIVKSNIKKDFSTNISKPKYAINDQDYEKYNSILDYLYKYPEKSEDILFKELESKYNQSSDELKNFVNSNMQNAIDRQSGKTTSASNLENSNIEDIIKKFLHENLKDSTLFSIDSSQTDIQITGIRSISQGNFQYNNYDYNYILKTEHSNDLQNVKVFQLKIDGIDIPLD